MLNGTVFSTIFSIFKTNKVVMLGLGIFDPLLDYLMNELVGKIFSWIIFGLVWVFAFVLDMLTQLFFVFAGMTPIGTSSVNSDTGIDGGVDIVNFFLEQESFQKAYLYLCGIALLLIVVFAIGKIIKQDYFDRNGPRSKGPIFRNIALSFIAFICIIPIFYFLVDAVGALALAVMKAMGYRGGGLGSIIFNLSWSDNGAAFQKAGMLVDGQPHSGQQIGDFFVEVTGNEIPSKVYDPDNFGWYSIDTFYVFKWDKDTRWFRNTGDITWYWYIFFFAAPILIVNLGKMMLAMVTRMFNLIALFIVAPSPISQIVLDDGNRFKTWKDKVLQEALKVVGCVMTFMIFMMIVNVVNEIDLMKFTYTKEAATMSLIDCNNMTTELSNSIDLLYYGGATASWVDKTINSLGRVMIIIAGLGAITDMDKVITPLLAGGGSSIDIGETGKAISTAGKAVGTGALQIGGKAVSGAVNLATNAVGATAGAVSRLGISLADNVLGGISDVGSVLSEKKKNKKNKDSEASGASESDETVATPASSEAATPTASESANANSTEEAAAPAATNEGTDTSESEETVATPTQSDTSDTGAIGDSAASMDGDATEEAVTQPIAGAQNTQLEEETPSVSDSDISTSSGPRSLTGKFVESVRSGDWKKSVGMKSLRSVGHIGKRIGKIGLSAIGETGHLAGHLAGTALKTGNSIAGIAAKTYAQMVGMGGVASAVSGTYREARDSITGNFKKEFAREFGKDSKTAKKAKQFVNNQFGYKEDEAGNKVYNSWLAGTGAALGRKTVDFAKNKVDSFVESRENAAEAKEKAKAQSASRSIAADSANTLTPQQQIEHENASRQQEIVNNTDKIIEGAEIMASGDSSYVETTRASDDVAEYVGKQQTLATQISQDAQKAGVDASELEFDDDAVDHINEVLIFSGALSKLNDSTNRRTAIIEKHKNQFRAKVKPIEGAYSEAIFTEMNRLRDEHVGLLEAFRSDDNEMDYSELVKKRSENIERTDILQDARLYVASSFKKGLFDDDRVSQIEQILDEIRFDESGNEREQFKKLKNEAIPNRKDLIDDIIDFDSSLNDWGTEELEYRTKFLEQQHSTPELLEAANQRRAAAQAELEEDPSNQDAMIRLRESSADVAKYSKSMSGIMASVQTKTTKVKKEGLKRQQKEAAQTQKVEAKAKKSNQAVLNKRRVVKAKQIAASDKYRESEEKVKKAIAEAKKNGATRVEIGRLEDRLEEIHDMRDEAIENGSKYTESGITKKVKVVGTVEMEALAADSEKLAKTSRRKNASSSGVRSQTGGKEVIEVELERKQVKQNTSTSTSGAKHTSTPRQTPSTKVSRGKKAIEVKVSVSDRQQQACASVSQGVGSRAVENIVANHEVLYRDDCSSEQIDAFIEDVRKCKVTRYDGSELEKAIRGISKKTMPDKMNGVGVSTYKKNAEARLTKATNQYNTNIERAQNLAREYAVDNSAVTLEQVKEAFSKAIEGSKEISVLKAELKIKDK